MYSQFFRYLFSRDISAIYSPDDLFALEQVFRTLQIKFENFSELADGMTPDSDVQEDFDDPQVQVSFVTADSYFGSGKGKNCFRSNITLSDI